MDKSENKYENMTEYINDVYNIAEKMKMCKNDDNKLIAISYIIYNYAVKMAKKYNVELILTDERTMNLKNIFDYILKI